MKKFEKVVKFARTVIGHMGAYFMITVLLLNLASGIVAGNGRTFSPAYFGVAVLFAFLLSLCDFVLNVKFIPMLLARSAIHVVLATLAFVISFVLVSGVVEGSTGFVGAIVFFIIDTVVLSVRAIYVNALNKKEKESEYNPVFTNGDE